MSGDHAWPMLLVLPLLFHTTCTTPRASGRGDAPVSRPVVSEYCRIAGAALGAVIKRFDEQPLGLDLTCVNRVASFEGRIYVDARFSRNGEEPAAAPDCRDERYVIRFDPKSFRPSPADQVVFLSLWSNRGGSWDFNAVVETPDWPHRRPETMSLSECGSAFGRAEKFDDVWKAAVTTPPKSTDAK